MNVIKECKFCNRDKFIFHKTFKVYNPETDEEEDINNVYECAKCGSCNFETEEFIISQKDININKENETAKLADYMNS